MNFTIYRGSWRRGGDGEELSDAYGNTALLSSRGMMCCLGQCAVELGVDRAYILGVGEPGDVDPDGWQLMDGTLLCDDEGRIKHTALTNKAMSINDDAEIDDEIREARLIALFLKHGHEIHFVDGGAPEQASA